MGLNGWLQEGLKCNGGGSSVSVSPVRACPWDALIDRQEGDDG